MNDWGLFGRTYENIAIGMANHKSVSKVICLLPPNRVAKGFFAFKLEKPKPNLFVITPNPRFFNSTGILYNLRNFFNSRISPLTAIKYFLKILGLKKSNTILWLFPHHPLINTIIKNIPHHLLITQIVDNVLNKTDIDDKTKALVTEQYDLLPRLSDITITSSQLNFNIFTKKSLSCHLIENGLDSSFISSPSIFPYKNTRPRLGYLGFISERTDVELLKYLATNRPEYDLIIAGPDEKSLLKISGIIDLPNVFYSHYISYKDAPAFISSLDVCLIPHIHSSFSQSMSPLKLFQYLGSGRPIVTTEVAGTERWKELIYIAKDVNDFCSKIDTALKEDTNLSIKRIKAAQNETWAHRINQLIDIISTHCA